MIMIEKNQSRMKIVAIYVLSVGQLMGPTQPYTHPPELRKTNRLGSVMSMPMQKMTCVKLCDERRTGRWAHISITATIASQRGLCHRYQARTA